MQNEVYHLTAAGIERSAEPRDFALALGGFLLLTVWKKPPWIAVVRRPRYRVLCDPPADMILRER
jgi:hypothetical protein